MANTNQTGAPPSAGKKHGKKKIVILLFALLVVGAIIYFDLFVMKIFSPSGPVGPGSTLKRPYPDVSPGPTDTQNISADKGGKLEIKSGNTTITLNIPPHSLKHDTTITISPVQPLPPGS